MTRDEHRGVRWGILGGSRIAQGVAPKIAAAESCRVTACASRDPARASAVCRAAGIDPSGATCTYDELLGRKDVDAVYIALMHHEHTQWCVRALEAGKHVLCEKPLCATSAEARRISAAAQRAGRLCAEGFMYMHHPQTRRLVELAGVPEAGGMGESPIGRLRAVRAWRNVRNNDQYILNTRLSHAMQGGSVMDLGCYPISAALLVTGAAATNVRASARWSKQRPGERGVVDEACTFSLSLPTSIGVIEFEGGCSFSDEPRVFVELIGERGTAWTDYPFSPHESRQVLLVNGKEEVFENAGDRFVLQFGRFARAVRGEEDMIPSMEFSIREAEAIEAIHRAIGLEY